MGQALRRRLRAALAFAVAVSAVPLVFALAPAAQALNNGVGLRPPMGWNDWNAFGCSISDALVRQTADMLVSSGMAAAGYQYVNIDDCWESMSRDASGNLQADPNKFPSGIKAVADYVHSKGLKIGIYSEAGSTTCSGFPGSLGHETQDANLFASWGIDYLKYDNCGDHAGLSNQQRYTTMRDALAASGRTIFYNLCEWGQDAVWTWGAGVGNSWRTTGDISANWGSLMTILDQQVGLENYAGPGGWNDPDMLEVGNSGITDTEARAQFSLWALLNAPLIAGNDLRNMTEATRTILTNTDVIAVDQDWGGKQGYKLRDDGDQEVWIKPMANGSRAVILLNRGASTATISTTATAIGLGAGTSYSTRDLWTHTTTSIGSTMSASVPSHGATMLLVSGGSQTTTTPPVTTRPPTTTTPPVTTRPPTTTTPPVTTRPPTTTTPPVTTRPPTTTTPPVTTRPPTTTTPPTGRACTATYRLLNSWPGGFQAEIAVTNAGSTAIAGWTVTWTFANGQTIMQAWNATVTASGAAITARNMSYNATLAPNAGTTFGFNGAWSGTNAVPATLACAAV